MWSISHHRCMCLGTWKWHVGRRCAVVLLITVWGIIWRDISWSVIIASSTDRRLSHMNEKCVIWRQSRYRVLRHSLVTLCSHKSGRCAVELYHAPHLWYPPFYNSPIGFQCSPTLNRQPYDGSWWRKSSMTVGQSSLISLDHHCCDWHTGNRYGWTCNQFTLNVDGGITGSRLRWSILT